MKNKTVSRLQVLHGCSGFIDLIKTNVSLFEYLELQLMDVVLEAADAEEQARAQRLASGLEVLLARSLELLD